MNAVIINLATEGYKNGQDRLKESLRNFWGKCFLCFNDEKSIGAPLHSENPYAFKIYAFKKALKLGYKQVLWIDASFFAVRFIEPLFDEILAKKQMFFRDGFSVADFINDSCLVYFKKSKEELKQVPMVMGGFIGLDFNSALSHDFLNLWEQAALNGAFKGSWKDHRHDQTCASIIINNLKIPSLKAREYCAYIGESYGQPLQSVFFHVQGIA